MSADAANSRIFYRGPSQLDHAPILGIVTGLATPSTNSKTGDMLQTYILREDVAPPEAVRLGLDSSICGACALRGDGNGLGRACYVQTKWAPLSVWKVVQPSIGYLRPPGGAWPPPELPPLITDRVVRLGTYGDPVAIPLERWEWLLQTAMGWTGYTHQWRTCDPAYRSICMASVDTPLERSEAVARGWRTFRVRDSGEPISLHEITCPASAEAGHKTTCAKCRLCDGIRLDTVTSASVDRRVDITIVAHGSRAGKVGTQVLPFEDQL